MKNFILVIGLFSIIGCANPKKLHKIMDKLPEATAKECAERYPINETIETVTVTDTALLHQYEIEFNYMAQLIDSLLSANCDKLRARINWMWVVIVCLTLFAFRKQIAKLIIR